MKGTGLLGPPPKTPQSTEQGKLGGFTTVICAVPEVLNNTPEIVAVICVEVMVCTGRNTTGPPFSDHCTWYGPFLDVARKLVPTMVIGVSELVHVAAQCIAVAGLTPLALIVGTALG